MLVLLLFLVFAIPVAVEKYYTVPGNQYATASQLDTEYQIQNPPHGRVHDVFKYVSPSEW